MNNESPNTEVLDEKELAAKLKALAEERVKKCSEEIQDVCNKYNCTLDTEVSVVLNGNKVNIVVVSK